MGKGPSTKPKTTRLDVTGIADTGAGTAEIEIGGRAVRVFVPGGLPGDTVEALVAPPPRGGRSATATITAILRESKGRTSPHCPHHNSCGGCPLGGLARNHQLRFKRGMVEKTFLEAGFPGVEVLPVESSDDRASRNKAVLHFGKGPGGLALGMYRPGTHQVVLASADCRLCPPWMAEAALVVLSWGRGAGLRAWSDGDDGLRSVMMREGSSGRMLTLVVSSELPEAAIKALAKALKAAGVTTATLSINRSPGNRVLGDKSRVFLGDGRITAEILGLSFSVRPETFLQVNPCLTPRLYETALDFCGLRPQDTVLDLYCGVGTLTLAVARATSLAIGVEIVPESIEEARENARANNIGNAVFHCGAARDVLPRLAREGERPRVVIVDPPRKGLEGSVPQILAGMAPETIVYIACGLKSLARDARFFSSLGYRVEKLAPFDLFPNSTQVETVARFTRAVP